MTSPLQESEVGPGGIALREVTWRKNKYSGENARIGDVVIGGVTWRMLREGKDWVATSALTQERCDFDRIDEARAWVEAQALAFVNRIASSSTTAQEERECR